MDGDQFMLSYHECLRVLGERLAEPAPGRIQLLCGPRQVGKTTLLLEIAESAGDGAFYGAGDAPEAALPGFLDRLMGEAEDFAAARGKAIVLLDEVHLLNDWAARLKGHADRIRRRKLPIHIVATGSSALRVATGSRESLAGRFERLTLTHWSAESVAQAFGIDRDEAPEFVVRMGSYPGACPLRSDPARWAAYVRDAILEPAIGRDILAMSQVRRPALLRQVFAVAALSPAQVLSLQKIQGQLQDRGALETIAHYLALLQEAFLVAAIPKYSARGARRRAAPPKMITLNNALLAVTDPRGIPDPQTDPARFGAWVENACLASALNAGQQVTHWREEPLEVDGVIEGTWGRWAVEVKTGGFRSGELRGLLEFVRRHPKFRPLVICRADGCATAERAGVAAMTWQEFLWSGPPRSIV